MREQIYRLVKDTTIKAPVLLLSHYNQLGLTIEETFFILEYLQFDGDLSAVSNYMNIKQDGIVELVNSLLAKQHITMDMTTTTDGKMDVVYSLDPLFQKMVTLVLQQEMKSQQSVQQETVDLVTLFEQEFGRVLSPTELEIISDWVVNAQYDEALIRLALKEAVMAQVLKLKYVDRVLLEWQRKNLTTVQQVEKENQQHRQFLTQSATTPATISDEMASLVTTNWLKR